MKSNELEEWLRSVQPEPEGIPVKYVFRLGDRPVDTTLALVAEHNRLEPDLLEDLYRQYNGNLNLALLAAVNDKNEKLFWNSLLSQFRIDFLTGHNLKRFMKNHNLLRKSSENIRRQLTYGAAVGNSVVLMGSQLGLLRYCASGKGYAAPEELTLWMLLEKAAKPDRNLTAEERSCLADWLGEGDVEILLSLENNLLLTPEAIRKLLALGGRVTRKENAELYTRLCESEKLPDTRLE